MADDVTQAHGTGETQSTSTSQGATPTQGANPTQGNPTQPASTVSKADQVLGVDSLPVATFIRSLDPKQLLTKAQAPPPPSPPLAPED